MCCRGNRLYVPTTDDQIPVSLDLLWGNRRTEVDKPNSQPGEPTTKTIFDDWRQCGEGEPTQEWWTASTHFTFRRERERDEVEEEMDRNVRPRLDEGMET